MRIGILGGSFNPVHRGHLTLASHAVSELNLDKVYFVPSHHTPLKPKEELLPGVFRAALLRRAIRRQPKFRLSDVELKRKGVSYTVDTLRTFRRKFGRKTVLYFLAGADNVRSFSRWKNAEEVLKLCRFTMWTRPGSSFRMADPRMLRIAMPPVAVSSSEIRRCLRAGRSVDRWIVPGTGRMLKDYFRGGKKRSKPRKK